jgi:hypothetical protein
MVDSYLRSEPLTNSTPIIDFDIQVLGDATRFTCGSRLRMEKDHFVSAAKVEHPALGSITSVGHDPDIFDHTLADLGPVRLEVDLQPHGRETAGAAPDQLRLTSALATWAWGTDGPDLARFVLQEPTAANSSDRPQLDDSFAGGDWATSDLWLLTSVLPMLVPDQTPWVLRQARMVYGPRGLLLIWHPMVENHDWNPNRAIPAGMVHPVALPECRRRHGQLSKISGVDGSAEAGRLVQDVMQHHDWTEWQLTQRVEHWERQFFELARDGAFSPELNAQHLGVALDETHRLLGHLRQVNRDIARRARLGWLPEPQTTPIDNSITSLADEVRERTDRVGSRIDHLNGSLRQGWTLLSSAAAGARLQLDRQSAERTQGFQNAAGLVAALVLVPGLVLSLYGAEVNGLPGMGERYGLAAILTYAVIGAIATFSTLRAMANRRRATAAVILAAGVLTLVGATGVLLLIGSDT